MPPTPREYAHEQLGLVISNALALRICDAKLGTLVGASADEIADAIGLKIGPDLDGSVALAGPTSDFFLSPAY